jgi:hypothetical protein
MLVFLALGRSTISAAHNIANAIGITKKPKSGTSFDPAKITKRPNPVMADIMAANQTMTGEKAKIIYGF